MSRGRRAGHAQFGEPASHERFPEPNDEATFARCHLDWDQRERAAHAPWLALYTHLLQLRCVRLVPHLAEMRRGEFDVLAPGHLTVHWPIGPRAQHGRLHLLANLGAVAMERGRVPPGEVLYDSHPSDVALAPWSVRVSLELRDA